MADYSANIAVKVKGLADVERLEAAVKNITGKQAQLEKAARSATTGPSSSKNATTAEKLRLKTAQQRYRTLTDELKKLNVTQQKRRELVETARKEVGENKSNLQVRNAINSALQLAVSEQKKLDAAQDKRNQQLKDEYKQRKAIAAEEKKAAAAAVTRSARAGGPRSPIGGRPDQFGSPANLRAVAQMNQKELQANAKAVELEKEVLRLEKRGLSVAKSKIKLIEMATAGRRGDLRAVNEIGKALKEEIADTKKVADIRRKLATERRKEMIATRRGQQLMPSAVQLRKGAPAFGGRAESLALGVGFPLMFGGGAGSILGSAAGSFLGKTGFGGQIIGGAIGQVLDQFVAATAQLGQALNTATPNLEMLVAASGNAGTSFGRLIQRMNESGDSAAALRMAVAELETLIGSQGVEALRRFGSETQRLGDEFAAAMTQMQAALAGLLAPLASAAANAVEGVNLRSQIQNEIASGGPNAERLQGTLGGIDADTGQRKFTEETFETMRQINAERQKGLEQQELSRSTLSQELSILEQQNQLKEIGGDLLDEKVYNLETGIVLQEKDNALQQLATQFANEQLTATEFRLKAKKVELEYTGKLLELESGRSKLQQAADDKAAREAKRLADQRRREAEKAAAEARRNQQAVAQNQLKLDRQVFENRMSLLRQQYELERQLQQQNNALFAGRFSGAGRSQADAVNQFTSGNQQVNDQQRQLEMELQRLNNNLELAKRGIGVAAITATPVTGIGGGGAPSSAASAVLAAADRNLGLLAGVSEQCANAIRVLFKEAGVAIGVTQQAWDGLGSGSGLASSFFGNDIGQQIAKADLKPGDLVAFEQTYGNWGPGVQTHVGMYAGNGMMYDHTSGRGLVKRPLDTFGNKFMYGVRPNAYGDPATGGGNQTGVINAQGSVDQISSQIDTVKQKMEQLNQVRQQMVDNNLQQFVQTTTQAYRDQTQALENQTQALQLKTRLEAEGLSQEVIQGEIDKLRLSQEMKERMEALTAARDEGRISTEAFTTAQAKLNAEMNNAIGAIDNNVQAQTAANQAAKVRQQNESDAKGIAGSLSSGLKNAIVTAIQGGDVKAALSQMLMDIGGRFLDMAFRPFEEAFAKGIANMLNGGTTQMAAGQLQQTAANTNLQAATLMAQNSAGGGGGGFGGLAGLLGGVFGGSGGGAFSSPSAFNGVAAGLWSFNGGGFTGNGVRSGGIDGRGGFPAILHPNETVIDHNTAMGRYSTSNSESNSPRTIRFESTMINNIEFVTREEAETMSRQAADDGARRGATAGFSRTMSTLKNSRSQRQKLGMQGR